MTPRFVSQENALQEPPAGWHRHLPQADFAWGGYTFLGNAGPLRSLPCRETREFGGCTHVGVFLPLCETHPAAREAAKRRLATDDPRAAAVGDRRWIHPISIQATRIYDLTRQGLEPQHGDYIVNQLFLGDGRQAGQAAWKLAKSRGCHGMLIPADVPVLFLYARVFASMTTIGSADPTPEKAPEK